MTACAALTGLLASAHVLAAAGAPLTAELVNPRGDARQARQAVVRFSEPVVRFGDPRAAAPAAVACAVAGEGRWLDERTWVYDFAAPLPSGLKCQLSMATYTTALSGARLGSPTNFAIETGGPAVVASYPEKEAKDIDEQQIFVLSVDGAVDPASVAQHARCEAEGVTESMPLRVLSGKARERQLAAIEAAMHWQFSRLLNPQAPWDKPAAGARDRLLVVSCGRTLPQGRAVRLQWNAGVRSASGVARTDDQALGFTVRRAFVAQFHCLKLTPKGACTPVGNVDLTFSSPVSRSDALRVRLIGKSTGQVFPVQSPAQLPPWVERLAYHGPFPPNETLRFELPPNLKDDIGRPLANADHFPLEIKLDDAPPLAKFAASFGILELNASPALPVTLRHAENPLQGTQASAPSVPGTTAVATDDVAMMRWLGRLERYQSDDVPLMTGSDQTTALSVPWPVSEATEVVGIPMPTPGLHVVELASPRLASALGYGTKPFYVRAGALVTNLAVHLKLGHENSLVWVTTLDTATPVAAARVVIRDCTGASLWEGSTDPAGLARIPKALPANSYRDREKCLLDASVFVSARRGNDVAFATSAWDRGIAPWDFGIYQRSYGYGGDTDSETAASTVYHSVLDRPLFRAGETVHMKHYVRALSSVGFEMPTTAAKPDHLTIRHEGTEQEWDVPLALGDEGTALSDWLVPADASLGTYSITLKRGKQALAQSGTFNVEEFRLPTMHAVLQLPRDPLIAPAEVPADAIVTYLAGGGASGAAATVRWRLEGGAAASDDYPDFSFRSGALQEGLQASGGGSADEESDDEDGGANGPAVGKSVVHEQPLTLDANGSARVILDKLGPIGEPGEIVAELEYPDANGQRLSVLTRQPVWPAAVRVGVRADRWPRRGEPFSVDVVALDVSGKSLPNQPVTVAAYQRTVYSYRKRLLGGFYSYSNQTDTRRLPDVCSGSTDALGRLHCTANYAEGQMVVFRAVAHDPKQRIAAASQQVWLIGADAWWGGADHDRMDLIPAERHYEVGQKAQLEARMPFRASTALVTVEREGILDAFVTKLTSKSPRISVPIRRGYSPNIFVSVLAVRGRVDAPQPTAMVDLGRPTFRLGLTELKVGHAPHRLAVRVSTDKGVYPTRGTAHVAISARAPDGKPASRAQVAFAAVDEALLELRTNHSWDLLAAMMTERPLEVATATAALQVIGKRHYGRKAVAPGGGGGAQPSRELFDTLLLWRGAVQLDGKGEAQLDVPLNDSLTSFRLTAVGSAGADLFGTGSTTVRTYRDLMLFAGIPEVIREGDQQQATVTLRNASQRPLSVTLAVSAVAHATGPDPVALPALPPQTIALASGESKELAWPVTVPRQADRLTWTFSASAEGVPGDRLTVRQRVVAWPGPPKMYQSTLMRVDQPRELAVERPADAVAGVGGISVAWSSSLVGGLSGVREYMAQYPYNCLEQRVSRAVALDDRAAWKEIVRDLPRYIDGGGLLKFFPSDGMYGSDVLTAYVLAVTQEAHLEIPEPQRSQLLQGLKPYADGQRQFTGVFRPGDLLLRRLMVIEALARFDQVTPQMLSTVTVEPNLWPTSALLDWYSTLRHMKDAASRDQARDIGSLVRTRLSYASSRLRFSTEVADVEWWLLRTPDQNAARAALLFADDAAWTDDLPRLITGAIGRQVHGHWDTTLANAWGSLAVRNFARHFERTPVTGTANVSLGSAQAGVDWHAHPTGATVALPWPDSGAGTASLTQTGTGAPWAMVNASAAIPLDKPLSAGYRVSRHVVAVRQAHPGHWTRGDLVRVQIDIDAAADMTWVAVNDPIPAGSSVVGVFARNAVPLGLESPTDEAWPIYSEAGYAGVRAYLDFLPRGHARVDYLLRLNTAGSFRLPATRVEAMYSPDIFGATPNAPMEVDPAQ